MRNITPTPWRIGAIESGMVAIDGANGEEVTGFVSPEDGRLIAAAPDLLEALREMVAGDAEAIEDAERIGILFPDEMLATYNKACAAIAKATGERL